MPTRKPSLMTRLPPFVLQALIFVVVFVVGTLAAVLAGRDFSPGFTTAAFLLGLFSIGVMWQVTRTRPEGKP
jgi:hypothetical protein